MTMLCFVTHPQPLPFGLFACLASDRTKREGQGEGNYNPVFKTVIQHPDAIEDSSE
jgi:hypothetical protein